MKGMRLIFFVKVSFQFFEPASEQALELSFELSSEQAFEAHAEPCSAELFGPFFEAALP